MKKILAATALFTLVCLAGALPSSKAEAQVPGAIISGGALGGFQASNLAGVGSGLYLALRGSFSNFFGEVRRTSWGNADAYVHEDGVLAGADFSVWHLMVSGGIGLGSATYQAPAVSGVIAAPQSYTSFLYEAQGMYQFDIVTGIITAGVGVNYVGESNSVAPISGFGGVAEISIGI